VVGSMAAAALDQAAAAFREDGAHRSHCSPYQTRKARIRSQHRRHHSRRHSRACNRQCTHSACSAEAEASWAAWAAQAAREAGAVVADGADGRSGGVGRNQCSRCRGRKSRTQSPGRRRRSRRPRRSCTAPHTGSAPSTERAAEVAATAERLASPAAAAPEVAATATAAACCGERGGRRSLCNLFQSHIASTPHPHRRRRRSHQLRARCTCRRSRPGSWAARAAGLAVQAAKEGRQVAADSAGGRLGGVGRSQCSHRRTCTGCTQSRARRHRSRRPRCGSSPQCTRLAAQVATAGPWAVWAAAGSAAAGRES